jgi:DNA-directed RNA polymerase specialized sigma24 family protein
MIDRCVAAPPPAEAEAAELIEAAHVHRAELREAMRAKLTRAMERLPPAEAEGLRLCSEGMRQADVGALCGMSQQRLSYRLLRAQYRLRLAVTLPELHMDVGEVARVLGTIVPRPMKPLMAAVLLDYWQTSNAMATARRLGMHERTAARYVVRGITCLSKAAERRPELHPMLRAFVLLRMHAHVLGARGRESLPDPCK